MTPAEVRRFQASGLYTDWLGQALKVDGVLGPKTEWAIALSKLPEWRQAIIRECVAHLGLREQPPGSNRGPEIDSWLRACGVPLGSPWCAASASYCMRTGAPDQWRARFGSVLGVAGALELGRRIGRITEKPLPGDYACYPTDDTGHGHGFLVGGANAAEVLTYEGNQRNEYRCLRRSRAGLLFYSLGAPFGSAPGVPDSVEFVQTNAAGTR